METVLRGYANKLAKLYQTSGVRHGSCGLVVARVETKFSFLHFHENHFRIFVKICMQNMGKLNENLLSIGR